MPDKLVKKAYKAKLAARESITNRLRLTLSELESVERMKDFLNAVKEEQESVLENCRAQLESVSNVMETRGLQNLEDDGEFYRAAYADDLIVLSISNTQLTQVRESLLDRPGFYPFVRDHNVNNQQAPIEVDEEEQKLMDALLSEFRWNGESSARSEDDAI